MNVQTTWNRTLRVAVVVPLAFGFASTTLAKDPPAKKAAEITKVDGREIFAREWIPGDPRAHGGDGLGPMFNESSCIGCHNQGGIGGGGPASKNVDIVTAFHNRGHHGQGQGHRMRRRTLPEQMFHSIFGNLDDPRSSAEQTKAIEAQRARLAEQRKKDHAQLVKMHPGFRGSPSVVLHRNGTFAGYQTWRSRMSNNFGQVRRANVAPEFFRPSGETAKADRPSDGQELLQILKNQVQFREHHNHSAQIGGFAIVRSQRNTTALFGAGAIDGVPVKALEELEKKQSLVKKGVSGRVARLKDGRAGRFGWKAQMASLDDFVLTACAVELGLNVPDHPQAGVPQSPDYQPKKLDLNQGECNALIGYVANLPAPKQRHFADDTDANYLAAGKAQFNAVGCAACHVETVGEAVGIFSDLLLHDLGPELGDTGSYGVFVPNSTPEGSEVPIPEIANRHQNQESAKKIVGATRQEWRTPPLWGVRDSAPYLHDGRAMTLEEAIALHGGEAAASAHNYFKLPAEERFKIETFLKSLVAPTEEVAAK
jgi:CxxC motif-containing protein (DUF1111 family)